MSEASRRMAGAGGTNIGGRPASRRTVLPARDVARRDGVRGASAEAPQLNVSTLGRFGRGSLRHRPSSMPNATAGRRPGNFPSALSGRSRRCSQLPTSRIRRITGPAAERLTVSWGSSTREDLLPRTDGSRHSRFDDLRHDADRREPGQRPGDR